MNTDSTTARSPVLWASQLANFCNGEPSETVRIDSSGEVAHAFPRSTATAGSNSRSTADRGAAAPELGSAMLGGSRARTNPHRVRLALDYFSRRVRLAPAPGERRCAPQVWRGPREKWHEIAQLKRRTTPTVSEVLNASPANLLRRWTGSSRQGWGGSVLPRALPVGSRGKRAFSCMGSHDVGRTRVFGAGAGLFGV